MSTTIQVRIEDSMKEQCQLIAEGMGIDLPTAVRIFLKQMVLHNGLPFEVKADPFYSESNIRHLRRVYEDVRQGKNLVEHALIEDCS